MPPVGDGRCEVYMNLIRRVVNLFPFIIQPGREPSLALALSFSLSLFSKGRITRVYGGWNVAGYSNALRGIIHGDTEGFQGRTADERGSESERCARGYGRWAEDDDSRAIRSRSKGFPFSFPVIVRALPFPRPSLNYFAPFEPRQRGHATRQPLHK